MQETLLSTAKNVFTSFVPGHIHYLLTLATVGRYPGGDKQGYLS